MGRYRLCVRLDPEKHRDVIEALEEARREGYGAVTRLVVRALRAYLNGVATETDGIPNGIGSVVDDASPEFWERMRTLVEGAMESALARYALKPRDDENAEEEEALGLLRSLAEDLDPEGEDRG